MISYTQKLDWAARALKPANISIKPKKLGMQLGDKTPTYWFGNNPFLTQFLTAFSATFPLGEQFMIDTVRIFRDAVKDNPLGCDSIYSVFAQVVDPSVLSSAIINDSLHLVAYDFIELLPNVQILNQPMAATFSYDSGRANPSEIIDIELT